MGNGLQNVCRFHTIHFKGGQISTKQLAVGSNAIWNEWVVYRPRMWAYVSQHTSIIATSWRFFCIFSYGWKSPTGDETCDSLQRQSIFFPIFWIYFFFAAQPRDSKETLIYRLKFVGDWLFDIIHGKIADKGGWLILWEWCSASVYSWPLLNTWGRQLIGVVRCYWKIRRLFRNWSNINIEYSSVL